MAKKVLKIEKCNDCLRKTYCTFRQVLMSTLVDKAWKVTLDNCPMYWAGDAKSTDDLYRESPVIND